MRLNGLQGSRRHRAAKSLSTDENPIANILNGSIKFHTKIGGYTPAEDIHNVFEFDPYHHTERT